MFINKYNLINAHSNDVVSENTILFTTEYLLLSNDVQMYKNLISFIELCKVEPGLFNQQPDLNSGKDKYMSHDTLTGLVAFSHKNNLNYHKDIWNYLVKHLFTYDNVEAKTNLKRILHPRDILYYGYCANNIICKVLYPLLLMFMIITCIQTYKIRNGNKIIKTDGKLLAWTRCISSNLHLTYELLSFILKLNKYFYSFENCFKIYFKEEQHPIRLLID